LHAYLLGLSCAWLGFYPTLHAQNASTQPISNTELKNTNTVPAVQEWNADDWEIAKPAINLLDITGYFRMRGDFIFDGTLYNGNLPGLAIKSYDASGATNSYGANMRARITPTLNISEHIQLISTIDIFDNLVMGSTPNTLPYNNANRVNILETGQNTPNGGWNAVKDAIQVRRLYARVSTQIGEFRFGRMPNHWGLGIFANNGDCIDCDHGDNVDRIALVSQIHGFYLTPMIDIMSSGPTNQQTPAPYGQARDITQLDDALQFSLQFAKIDTPEDIRTKLASDKVVVNYGLWGIGRYQIKESKRYFTNPSQTIPVVSNDPLALSGGNKTNTLELETRDAFAVIFDAWTMVQYKKFKFEFEGLMLYSKFKMSYNNTSTDPAATSTQTLSNLNTTAFQWGFAIDSRYDIFPELFVRLRTGVASSDSHNGFGIGADAYDRLDQVKTNRTINNFQFNKDYRIDTLFFRDMLGTVTGAWYLKPEVAYTFSNGIGLKFAPMYAHALTAASTPSQQGNPLGVELDAEAFFNSKKIKSLSRLKGFDLSIAYGLFIPTGPALSRVVNVNNTAVIDNSRHSVAHRLIIRAAVAF